MYPCLLLKVLAEYYLQLCACSKRDSCVPVFLYALRGDTRPGYISRGVGEKGGGSASFSFVTGEMAELWVRTHAARLNGRGSIQGLGQLQSPGQLRHLRSC